MAISGVGASRMPHGPRPPPLPSLLKVLRELGLLRTHRIVGVPNQWPRARQTGKGNTHFGAAWVEGSRARMSPPCKLRRFAGVCVRGLPVLPGALSFICAGLAGEILPGLPTRMGLKASGYTWGVAWANTGALWALIWRGHGYGSPPSVCSWRQVLKSSIV